MRHHTDVAAGCAYLARTPSGQGTAIIFFIWILVGGLLGWATSRLIGIRDRRGILLNVVVGVLGVPLAGWLLGGLVGTSEFIPGQFSLAGLMVSVLGAAVLLAGVQLLGGAAERYAPRRLRHGSPVFGSSWKSLEGERAEFKKAIRAGRALRPLIAVGLAGMLLLVAV